MKDALEKSKDDFDGWVAKWDKALQDKVFGDTPKIPSTGDATADFSFFGLRQDNHSDNINPSDADYWNAINSVADGGVEMRRLDEADAGMAPLAGLDPNPVRRGTEGKDQDLAPEQLGVTFDEKDVSDLADMKVKLHDLGSKNAEMGDDDQASRLAAMIKQIDDLSDRMCRPKKK